MRNLDKRVHNTYYTSNTGSIGAYLNDISKYKILTDKETKKEIAKAKKGDQIAMEKLVNTNQRFVFSLAKRFSNGDNSLLSDLINEANIGLIKSIESFDLKRENTFLTHSVYWMQRQIFLYLTFVDPMVKVSNKSKTAKVSEIRNKFFMLNGRNPTSEEILTELQETYGIDIINESDIYQVKSISIDGPTMNDTCDDFSSYFAFNQNGAGNSTVTSQNEYNTEIENDYAKMLISNSIGILTDKERNVIELLYGIGEYREYEIQEVAEKMGISKEGVRLINLRALDKLKEEIKVKKLSI